MNRSDIPWHEPMREARLRQLWAEGHSTYRIAEMLAAEWHMPVSKNAVVGRAHRIGVPSRPSPINLRNATRASKQIKRAPKVTLLLNQTAPTMSGPDPVVEIGEQPNPTYGPIRQPHVEIRPAALRPRPVAVADIEEVTPPAPILPRPQRPSGCCWPIGEPGAPGFRYCDGPHDFNKPYCDEHRKRSRRQRTAEAA